jgi:hypothetical protein
MIFEFYPLTEELHKYRRKEICLEFPAFNKCNHNFYLSLWKYLISIPERFYSKKASEDMFAFLENLKEKDIKILENILKEFDNLLSLAFKALNEINQLEFHDIELSWDEYKLMQFCDSYIHPNYLKLAEGVYSNLIIPFSAHQRIIRSKKLEGFDVFNRVEELKSTKYEYLSKPYNNTVRNAIAHGKVSYRLSEIKYEDKSDKVSLSTREIVGIFDRLLDICNGLSLGLCLFYLVNLDSLEEYRINIPQQITIEELIAEIDAPGWEIEGCLESETILDKRSQLNIYVKNQVFDPQAYQYHAFRSAILAEKLVPGYDRYFIILDPKYFKLGLVAFDGLKLKMLRTKNDRSPQDYVEALEDHLILIEPKIKLPRLFYKIITLLSSFKIIMPLKLEESKETSKLFIDLRYTEIHRDKYHSVINGRVVIKINSNEPIDNLVRTNCNSIVKKTIKVARKKAKITNISRYLQLGYLLIYVYSEDFRIRELKSAGLIPELLCTIEFKRLQRKRTVDIIGGKPEIIKKFRIVWNKHPII